MDKRCPQCEELLIEIDHYGERLIGCVRAIAMVRRGCSSQLDEADIIAL